MLRTAAALSKCLLSAAIISLINKTWLADTDLLERAKGAVAPSLVSPGAACVLLIMWHSGSCLVIHDEAAATPRMCQGSQGPFFFSCVNNRNLQEKKKKDLEYEKDEGGKTAALSLISSPLCLCKSAANAEKSI